MGRAPRVCVKRHGYVCRMLKHLGVVWGMGRLKVWLEDSVLAGKGRGPVCTDPNERP